MKSENYQIMRYDADEGKVFDWVDLEAHQSEVDGEVVINHLYAKTIFIGQTDSIENYVEVDYPVVEE